MELKQDKDNAIENKSCSDNKGTSQVLFNKVVERKTNCCCRNTTDHHFCPELPGGALLVFWFLWREGIELVKKSQKSSETLSGRNWLSSSIWPVDEIGNHSVIPSTTPNNADLSASIHKIADSTKTSLKGLTANLLYAIRLPFFFYHFQSHLTTLLL